MIYRTKGDLKRMETVISFTPAQLVAFIGSIAGACAGLATITGFIVAIIKRLKAPEVEQNRRIEALEKKLEEERKERIAKDLELSKQLNDGNDRFNKNDESFVIILETLQALLKHALGGGKSELEKAEVNLNKYLTSKVVQSKP